MTAAPELSAEAAEFLRNRLHFVPEPAPNTVSVAPPASKKERPYVVGFCTAVVTVEMLMVHHNQFAATFKPKEL